MKNYADLGGCYPPKPNAEADNTLLDLHNSSYHTQPHPIIANYFAWQREASNCTILTVIAPIYATGGKKPEKIQGFNGIQTCDLHKYRCDAPPTEL